MLSLCVTAVADCKAKCWWGDDEPFGVIVDGKCICGHEFNSPVRLGRGTGRAIIDPVREKKSYLYE